MSVYPSMTPEERNAWLKNLYSRREDYIKSQEYVGRIPINANPIPLREQKMGASMPPLQWPPTNLWKPGMGTMFPPNSSPFKNAYTQHLNGTSNLPVPFNGVRLGGPGGIKGSRKRELNRLKREAQQQQEQEQERLRREAEAKVIERKKWLQESLLKRNAELQKQKIRGMNNLPGRKRALSIGGKRKNKTRKV